jgi:hypothetical protein
VDKKLKMSFLEAKADVRNKEEYKQKFLAKEGLSSMERHRSRRNL